jgi:hypothetical protein
VVDGTEGPGSFDELDKLVVASPQPLQTYGGGPASAERKVRGELPEGSRLRTRAADDETKVAGEEGRKYVGLVGTKGGREGQT